MAITAALASSAALKRPARSGVTATAMAALPSATPTTATTPEPTCFSKLLGQAAQALAVDAVQHAADEA